MAVLGLDPRIVPAIPLHGNSIYAKKAIEIATTGETCPLSPLAGRGLG
jgi:hypothetical protein